MAPPFSGLDTLPALGAVAVALAIILDDIALVAIGIVLATIGVVLIVTIGAAIVHVLRGLSGEASAPEDDMGHCAFHAHAERSRADDEQADPVSSQARRARPTCGWTSSAAASPSVVSTTPEEYRACRETAALMDFSMLRKVYLDGPGAQALVNGVVCRDVSRLEPGRIAYSAMTNEQGKMVDDCTVMALSSDRVQFCGANDADHAAFAAEAEGTDIRVAERTDEVGHLCLQGPGSRRILQTLTTSDLSNGAFPYYTDRTDVRIADIPVFMTRLGYTAELGYELWVENEHALSIWDALVARAPSSACA